MKKPLVDLYFKALEGTGNPVSSLTQFYCDLFNLSVTRPKRLMIKRLIELYGKWRVFYALTQMGSIFYEVTENVKRPEAYLRKLLVGQLEAEHKGQYTSPVLDELSDENEKLMANKKEIEDGDKD